MAKKKEFQIQAVPELDRRGSDLDVPNTVEGHHQLLQIRMLAGANAAKPYLSDRTFFSLPGGLRLRFFKKGEVICRQFEPGWTAFSILTDDDVQKLFTVRGEPAEFDAWKARVDQQRSAEALDFAARVFIQTSDTRADQKPRRSWLDKLLHRPAKPADTKIDTIKFDGPKSIDARTNTSTIAAGRLFGEMSCLNRQPRAATIVAAHDCYAIEMLRAVLDALKRDKGFQAELLNTYLEYLKDRQFLRMDVFAGLADLPEAERATAIELIRSSLEIVRFNPGEIICDEFAEPEALHIVRIGMVRVLKGVSAIIRPHEIVKPDEAVQRLQACKGQPATTVGKILAAVAEVSAAEITRTLNHLIKGPPLWDGCTTNIDDRFQQRLDPTVKTWPDSIEKRRLNRLFLERILGDAIAPLNLPPVGSPEHVINYCSRDDVIGEMGLLDGLPHGATCVAHSHPEPMLAAAGVKPEDDWIECVRLRRSAAEELLNRPGVRERLEAKAAQRRQADTARQQLNTVQTKPNQSPRFNELGLVQGRKLMLIDLDRCTRCDECVKGCVNSHTDGMSRLFLDGPRIGRFLIPTTCRSCHDPVCMLDCPVGSIRRGDNDQIVIENWCIGCSKCADNCPYGSIQMHEMGVIGAASWGWRYSPNPGDPSRWTAPKFNDDRWPIAASPFGLAPDVQPGLMHYAFSAGQPLAPCGFRMTFRLDAQNASRHYRLVVWSLEKANTRVWINGRELPAVKPEKERGMEFAYPPRFGRGYVLSTTASPAEEGIEVFPFLRDGTNLLAVQVDPPAEPEAQRGIYFDARLNAVLTPDIPDTEEVELRLRQVTQRAVVCDLCADLHNQQPACVNACPHDAAMRVNAWSEFPIS